MRAVAWWVSVVGLVAGAASAEERPWTAAAEAGYGLVHGEGGPGAAVRLSRDLGRGGLVRAQLGVSAFGFRTLDAGLELRLCPSCRVSPVVGAAAGLLAEDEYGGSSARGTIGLEARVSPRVVLRATAHGGVHGGQAGPWSALAGVGWRF